MRIALPESPAAARSFAEGFYSRFTPMVWLNADGYRKTAVRGSPLFFGGRQNIHRAADKKEMRFQLTVNERALTVS
jgi:hypothetical protein